MPLRIDECFADYKPVLFHWLACGYHTPVPVFEFQDYTGAKVRYPRILVNTADLTADQTDKALRLASSLGIKGVDFHDNAELPGVAKAVDALGRNAFFLTTKINKPPTDMTDPAKAATLAQKQFDDDMAVLKVVARSHSTTDLLSAQLRLISP